MSIYDSIVIGGGPAGLSALLYLGRGMTKSLMIEKSAPGGQMLLTSDIENYLGFPGGIGAFDLVDKMEEHSKSFGGESVLGEVSEIENAEGEIKIIRTNTGDEYKTKSIILATGSSARKIGIKGEKEFAAKGVSYCGTCDGFFFKDKTIAVIGGGDTAFDEALFLTRFASKIYLIHRRQGFRAMPILIDRVKKTGKVEFVLDTIPLEIMGEEKVNSIKVKNVKTEEENTINLDGVFVFIGADPSTNFLKTSGITINDSGYIKTDFNMNTNIKGIFAAGDAVEKEERQVANAVGEGAVAACQAIKYISTLS